MLQNLDMPLPTVIYMQSNLSVVYTIILFLKPKIIISLILNHLPSIVPKAEPLAVPHMMVTPGTNWVNSVGKRQIYIWNETSIVKKNLSLTIFTVAAQVVSRTVLQYTVYSFWYRDKGAYSWLYWLIENSAPEKGIRNWKVRLYMKTEGSLLVTLNSCDVFHLLQPPPLTHTTYEKFTRKSTQLQNHYMVHAHYL